MPIRESPGKDSNAGLRVGSRRGQPTLLEDLAERHHLAILSIFPIKLTPVWPKKRKGKKGDEEENQEKALEGRGTDSASGRVAEET